MMSEVILAKDVWPTIAEMLGLDGRKTINCKIEFDVDSPVVKVTTAEWASKTDVDNE